MANRKFSVLMSVYNGENVLFFRQAIDSVLNQTVMPDEIVLVRDGLVYDKLQNVIDEYLHKYPQLFTYVPLETNCGLGKALNIGVSCAKYELIARMDTDDICVANRFELQLKAFDNDPDLDMVGGQVYEFITNSDEIVGKHAVPVSHDDIVFFLKSRNAFNHPTVMYKKDSVLSAGNYIEMHFVEDYYLWCRMLVNGCKFANLQDVLVNMRVSTQMYQRRGGYTYYKILKQLEDYKINNSITSHIDCIKNKSIRFFQCVLLPNKVRGFLYQKLLRKISQK